MSLANLCNGLLGTVPTFKLEKFANCYCRTEMIISVQK